MPYPSEHAARINDPGKYDTIRRQNDKFGPGIDVIFGIKDGKTEVQAIRFDKKRFTARRASAWLKKHNYSATVEPAKEDSAKKEDTSGAVPYHDGVMIALKIPEALRDAIVLPPDNVSVPGSTLPKEELHVTLAYLGKVTEQTYVKEKLIDTLKRFVTGMFPIVGSLNGVARFSNIEDNDTQAFVTLVDAPSLPTFRQNLVNELKWQEINVSTKHGFTPHITLAYVPIGGSNPQFAQLSIPVIFDTIFLAWGEEKIEFRLEGSQSSFSVYKQENGQYRWVMLSSNAFQDRDREIISTKALQEDVERADKDNYYGPLRWWHVGDFEYKEAGKWDTSYATQGLDIGTCDFNMLHGRVLIESGTFRNEQIAERVKELQDRLQGSIAFTHPVNEPDNDGVFKNIRRFERSLLPKGRASNPFVTLVVKGSAPMASLADKIKAFKALLRDDELVNSVLASAENVEKEAKEAGIAFKESETKEEVTTPDEKPNDQTSTKETETEPKPDETNKESVETPSAEEQPVETKEEKPVETAVETEKAKADKPTDKPTEDKPVEETEPEEEFVGDMTKKALAEMVMKACAAVMDKRMGEMDQRMGKKEASDAASLKEQSDKLVILATEMNKISSAVKELQGDIPKAFVNGFRASQAKETEISEEAATKKGAPNQDPKMQTLDEFTKFAIGQ